jgi:rod shape-determining protein MreC
MTRGPVGTRLRPARRTSFARRESNLVLLGALLTGATLALALILLLIERADPEQGSRLRGAGADLLRPIHAVVAAPVRLLHAGVDRIGVHFGTADRLRAAEAELVILRRRAAEADVLAAEVARLDALLLVRRPERRVVATAMVSAAPAQASQRTAIIGAGLTSGVRPQMPVIAADGLAGRVTDTGVMAARMLLLTDAASRVPVKLVRTGWTGLAVGTGGTRLRFETDMAGLDRVRVGDRLVTSGDGGIFPPGIPVAVIVDAEASPALARPLANPAGLGVVTVEAPWMPPAEPVAAAPAPPEADQAIPPGREPATNAAPPAPGGAAP